MKLYSDDENYKLYHGSMLDMAEVIEPESIDIKQTSQDTIPLGWHLEV